jgi:hypothetical protein
MQVVTHHEEAVAPWFFDEIPAIVIFLTRYVFYWFNSSIWRWSPCTRYSVLKPELAKQIGRTRPLLKK